MSDYKKLKVWEDAHKFTKGSAFEVEYQLLLAKDLNYITNEEYKFLMAKIQSIICMLTGLIKSLKTKN